MEVLAIIYKNRERNSSVSVRTFEQRERETEEKQTQFGNDEVNQNSRS